MFMDYLFEDTETGELFFAEATSLSKAWDILNSWFGDIEGIKFIDEYTPEEADLLGYDTY